MSGQASRRRSVAPSIAYWAAGVLLVLAALVAGTAWYVFWLPERTFKGPLPPPTQAERDLAGRLHRHVSAIASEPHNVAHYAALEKAARYIEGELASIGYAPQAQVFEADRREVRNIEAVIEPAGATAATPTLVIGAHYDSAGMAPGANDNASGTAAVLELARLLKGFAPTSIRLRFVAFVNEEPPYDRSAQMGSVRFAEALKAKGERVFGMISLETLGCFFDEPGTQKYPSPFGLVFPSTANFVAFVAMPGSRSFLHEVIGPFRRHTQFPTIGGTAPDQVPGIGWSDHWSFWQQGFPAIMITDTALFRYPHYHKTTDTPEKVDYDKLARITLGLEAAIRDIVK